MRSKEMKITLSPKYFYFDLKVSKNLFWKQISNFKNRKKIKISSNFLEYSNSNPSVSDTAGLEEDGNCGARVVLSFRKKTKPTKPNFCKGAQGHYRHLGILLPHSGLNCFSKHVFFC